METVKGYDGDSIDWRGINPDGTPDERMLADVTRSIVDAVNPERIILFGSAARGEMRAKSDLDVLVVKEGDHYRAVSRKMEEARERLPGTAPQEARRQPRRSDERGHRSAPRRAVLRHPNGTARRTRAL